MAISHGAGEFFEAKVLVGGYDCHDHSLFFASRYQRFVYRCNGDLKFFSHFFGGESAGLKFLHLMNDPLFFQDL